MGGEGVSEVVAAMSLRKQILKGWITKFKVYPSSETCLVS